MWNKKHIIGEVQEDDIMNILNKDQLIDFYHMGKNNFKVDKIKIEKHISRNDK